MWTLNLHFYGRKFIKLNKTDRALGEGKVGEVKPGNDIGFHVKDQK